MVNGAGDLGNRCMDLIRAALLRKEHLLHFDHPDGPGTMTVRQGRLLRSEAEN